jgi:hypothetical protein
MGEIDVDSTKKKLKIPLLTIMSVAHTILTIVVIVNIIFYSFDINYPIFDFFSALVPLSFIIFNRCIHLDFHEYIKDGDPTFPAYTEDTYFFSKIQKFIFGKELITRSDTSEYKGNVVYDISPFCEIEDYDVLKNVFNEKIHYIVINCILIVILLTKYKYKKLIPMFVLWFFYIFN